MHDSVKMFPSMTHIVILEIKMIMITLTLSEFHVMPSKAFAWYYFFFSLWQLFEKATVVILQKNCSTERSSNMSKITQPIVHKTSMATQTSPTPELKGQSTTPYHLMGLHSPRVLPA